MVFGSSCNYSVNLCYVEGAQDLLPRGPTLAGPSEVVSSPRIRPVSGRSWGGAEQERCLRDGTLQREGTLKTRILVAV